MPTTVTALRKWVTPLGKWAMATGALSLIVGTVFGWQECLAIAVLLGLLLTAAVITTRKPLACEATIKASHENARIGDSIELHIEIRNAGPYRSAAATVHLPIAGKQHSFTMPPMRSQQSASITVTLTAAARAVVPVGPLTVHRSDPCGFIRRKQSYSNTTHIVIQPQTVRLPSLRAGLLHSLEGVNQQHAVDDGLEFHALRSYQPGDDIRHIHWPSSAKSGDLMLKQYFDTGYPITALTLDTLWKDYPDADEFELAVSAYASLGLQCLDEHQILFCNESGKWYRPGDAWQFLFQCADIRFSGTDYTPFADYLTNTAPQASLHIFIVGSEISTEQFSHVIRTYTAFDSLVSRYFVIIRIKQGVATEQFRSANYTILDVGSLDDLTHALLQWDKAT